MTELSVVGKSVTRVDAIEKVTGAAKYTTDERLGLAGMLYGKVLFSPYPHAKIVSIDTFRAERVPEVMAVMTGKDVPDPRMGMIINDRHILCRNKVRFVGDAVAVVAAANIEAAEEALDLIRVEYEELPPIFDVEEAMIPDCPVVLHPDLASYNRPIYDYLGRDLPGPNVHTHHKIRKGSIDEGFRKSDLIIENRFLNARITHCQPEPFSSVANVESDGSLTVWTSMHTAFGLRSTICRDFNLPLSKVRVRSSYLGGNFGASPRAERFAVLLALKTRKPIKIDYSRKESFIDGLNRIPLVIYIKDGVKKDGTLLAREMKVIVNTGAYTDIAPLTIRNAVFHASQYRIPNFRWDAYGVYTNEPPSGPYRGFGSGESLWAVESQMDIIAEKLGMNPVELRKKNIIKEGEENIRGEITHSIGAEECLDRVAKWIRWNKPSGESTGSLRKGKGIALGNKYTQADVAATAIVKVHLDGIIEVLHGSNIKVTSGDTSLVAYDSGAISSKTTIYTGNAVRLACEDAKRQIFQIAAPKLGAALHDLEIGDGKVYMRESPEKALPIAELSLAKLPGPRGFQAGATCLADGGGEIVGKAVFYGKPSEEDPDTGQGKVLAMSYCYVAQAAEVAVDIDTGMVRVLRFCSAADVGRAINPKLCEGQMEGGAAQGIGSALYEGFVFDEKGKLLNPNFTDYRVPSSRDIPSGINIESIIVEASHKDGPYGAKGMGEAAMVASAPAIANAIHNAIGARIVDLPITPEKVLKAFREGDK
jgi:carbon-monoxide dehydrogenase large subunit